VLVPWGEFADAAPGLAERGARLFGVADEGVFRRICYALIVIAVVVSLPVLDGVIR